MKVRWTAEKGMRPLGELNKGIWSEAYGVNADGSIIVGYIKDGAVEFKENREAFRWSEKTGIEAIGKLLAQKGILPPKWRLTEGGAITPSGTVIVGSGFCEVQLGSGKHETQRHAWRAVIPKGKLF